jgi:Cu+-exporting ATPase
VLFRDAAAIEHFRRIDTLIVDKTGTLTEGRPQLARVIAATGHDESEVLRIAASLERGSEHPLARALLSAAQDKGLRLAPAREFESIAGRGVRGIIDGKPISLGNAALMQEHGADISSLASATDAARAEGASVVYLARESQLLGALAIADQIKTSTPDALAELRASGIRVVMASGDAVATAEFVAKQLGIDEAHGAVQPGDKAELVRRLQREGHIVGMAGDGINDAPALAQADVGIAMGSGTDVAMNTAQVTLVKGDLRGLARARAISLATVRNMRQNLAFAFLYNALGVPIAAGALYPFTGLLLSPMIAALAMSLSSVSVITNALRLRAR